METPWLTRKEAAAYLKISVVTLNRRVLAGDITRHGTARSPRYLRADLDKAVKSESATA